MSYEPFPVSASLCGGLATPTPFAGEPAKGKCPGPKPFDNYRGNQPCGFVLGHREGKTTTQKGTFQSPPPQPGMEVWEQVQKERLSNLHHVVHQLYSGLQEALLTQVRQVQQCKK